MNTEKLACQNRIKRIQVCFCKWVITWCLYDSVMYWLKFIPGFPLVTFHQRLHDIVIAYFVGLIYNVHVTLLPPSWCTINKRFLILMCYANMAATALAFQTLGIGRTRWTISTWPIPFRSCHRSKHISNVLDTLLRGPRQDVAKINISWVEAKRTVNTEHWLRYRGTEDVLCSPMHALDEEK